MSAWPVTTSVAALLLDPRGRLRRGRLVDAVTRAALLLDAATARFVAPQGDGVHVSSTNVGFAPANALLTQLDEQDGDLRAVVCDGVVGLEAVAVELVERGWWHRLPESVLQRRPRYQPSDLFASTRHDAEIARLLDMLDALGAANTDFDELLDAARVASCGAGTWAVLPIFTELVELRLWLQAAATTPQGGGDGGG